MGSTSSTGQLNSPAEYDCTGWQLADRYEFIRVLGAGGTGTVYLARDLLLTRQVAVKTILPALADNLEIRRRINHECRLHATIGVHPNIVTLYDKLEVDGRIYLVMEYVQGKVLADILTGKAGDNSVELSIDGVISLARQLLLAIACIHEHGILHRDIKTSNILVQRQAEGENLVKLMDFGIAMLEENGDAITRLTQLNSSGPGTPTYMAPERIDPQKYGASSPATDLYSVGVILYQLLSDGPPFRGTISEIFNGHLFMQVDLSRLCREIPPGLRDIVAKALAKEPKKRFPDAISFVAALNRETAGHPHLQTAGLPVPGNDLTLLVIESAGQLEMESTVLAPEPKIMATPLPDPGKNNRYLIVLGVASLCVFFFFFSVRLFLSAKSKNKTSPDAVTEISSTQAVNVRDGDSAASDQRILQIDNGVKTSALEALQKSRTSGQVEATSLPLENRLEQRLPFAGDPDWQILEQNAQRIDR